MHKLCPTCAGTGAIAHIEQETPCDCDHGVAWCPHCKSSGWYTSPKNGLKHRCHPCDGEGATRCTTCKGTGRKVVRHPIACSACRGKGLRPIFNTSMADALKGMRK